MNGGPNAQRVVAGLRALESPRGLAIATTLGVATLLWIAVAIGTEGHLAHASHSAHMVSAVGLSTRAIMWVLMMAAMMLPVAVPMFAAYAEICARESAGGRLALRVAAFGLGYLLLWSAYAVAAAGLQGVFDRGGARVSPATGAGLLLVVAGAYQWLPIKEACLRHCRSPIAFLLAHWRPGTSGGWRLGIRHGAYCLGCCAALMGLMFVFGTLSLLGMAALAAYCVAERVAPGAERWSRWAGAMLLAGGVLVLARPWI